MDLMHELGLNEAIDRLTMASSMHRYKHMLKMEDDHVLSINVQDQMWK